MDSAVEIEYEQTISIAQINPHTLCRLRFRLIGHGMVRMRQKNNLNVMNYMYKILQFR